MRRDIFDVIEMSGDDRVERPEPKASRRGGEIGWDERRLRLRSYSLDERINGVFVAKNGKKGVVRMMRGWKGRGEQLPDCCCCCCFLWLAFLPCGIHVVLFLFYY